MSIQIFAPDIKDNRVVLNPDNSIAFQQWTVNMANHSIRKKLTWSEITRPVTSWEQMEATAVKPAVKPANATAVKPANATNSWNTFTNPNASTLRKFDEGFGEDTAKSAKKNERK